MKKAIVIGASSGIGRATALLLLEEGHRVGITGRRANLLKEVEAMHPTKAISSTFDCTTDSNTEKLENLVNQLGGLDLLLLSSGTGDLNESLNFDIEDRTNQLNVVAFTEIVTWAYKFFAKQSNGQLIVISSIAGLRGSKVAPAYNASKAYQINYLEGLRQKAQTDNKSIYITDIRPGFVDTDMAKGEGQFWVASKEKAAKQIIGLIKKKKQVAYVTKRWGLIAFALKLLPNWLYKRM